MSETKKISAIQVALSILIQFLCLALSVYLKEISINDTMVNLVCISTAGFLLCLVNSDLYILHFNRFRQNKSDCLLFTFIGILIYGFIFFLNHFIIHAEVLTIDYNIINNIIWILPLFICVNCFVAPLNFTVIFKLLTDRLPIRKKESMIIVLSALISALFFTLLHYSSDFVLLNYFRQFCFLFLLSLNCSYLYNQSHSLACSTFSLSFILLVLNLIH